MGYFYTFRKTASPFAYVRMTVYPDSGGMLYPNGGIPPINPVQNADVMGGEGGDIIGGEGGDVIGTQSST